MFRLAQRIQLGLAWDHPPGTLQVHPFRPLHQHPGITLCFIYPRATGILQIQADMPRWRYNSSTRRVRPGRA